MSDSEERKKRVSSDLRNTLALSSNIPPDSKLKINAFMSYGNLLFRLDVIEFEDLRTFSSCINKNIDFFWQDVAHLTSFSID